MRYDPIFEGRPFNIIQGSVIKISGRKLRCIAVWWNSGKRVRYEFLEIFDEPQVQELLVRDADYIHNLVMEGKITENN